jgi:hypothetical protein
MSERRGSTSFYTLAVRGTAKRKKNVMAIGGKQVSKIIRFTNGVSVLLLALLVRLTYCFVIAPRQLCGLNDHGNCELGSMVATAMQSRNLKYLALPIEGPVFGPPSNLIDFLVRSGPVHPLYLGTIFHFSGLGGTLDAARVNCWSVVLANCAIDSLACVGIYYAARLIFNRRAAVLAALLSVIYPGAVLNTMHCYPESLGYAMVSVWICLASALMLRRRKNDLAWLTAYALGVVSALIAFCVPALMAMPIFAGGLMAAYKIRSNKNAATLASYIVPTSTLLLGCASVLAPWFWMQQTAMATIRLCSLTALESQLWTGNLIPCEGWSTIPPLDLFGDNFALTMRNFLKSLALAPIQYFCLFCQKVPRLWAGCWNDYGTSLFGLNAIGLNIWHGLLLFCAFLGASLSSLHHTRWRDSRTLVCSVGLAAIIVYHFAFSIFSPVSRNALTALPAIIVLAAGALEQLIRKNHSHKSTLLLFGAAILLFWRLASGSCNIVPFVIGVTLSELAARISDIALIAAAWIVLLQLALRVVRSITNTQVSSASDMLKVGCFFAVVGTIGCGYADQRWREWSANLKSGNDAVLETIKLPDAANIPQLDTAGCAFVLLDISAGGQPPPVVAAVNHVSNGSEPIPWLMLKPFDLESFKTLALTANGMGRDWRSFRQWWAIPVPFSALKFGQDNQVSVMLQRSEQPLSCSVFGQYGLVRDHQNGTGTVSIVPSMNTVSWDKGFATYEAGDIRLIEPTIMQGKVVDSGLSNGTTVMKGDLSYEHGLQGGNYRMRLAVPIRTGFTFGPVTSQSQPTPTSQMSVPFLREDAITISGSDTSSQSITGTDCILPAQTTAGSLLTFQCDLRGFTDETTGAISIELAGTDEFGQPINWTSHWQPVCVDVSKEWKPFSVSEFVPESFAQSKDLHAVVKIIPYDAARLIAHRDAALKQQIGAKQMKLELQSFVRLPREQNRDWVVF